MLSWITGSNPVTNLGYSIDTKATQILHNNTHPFRVRGYEWVWIGVFGCILLYTHTHTPIHNHNII